MNRHSDQKVMSFGEHLEELRLRLIYALAGLVLVFIVCLFFRFSLFRLMWRPMERVLAARQTGAAAGGPMLTSRPVFTEPSSAFLTTIKVSFVAAFVIASPWVLYQMWAFISAGLYPHERRYVYVLGPFSLLSFAAGVLFCYLLLMPIGLDFLIGQGSRMGALAMIKVNSYFSFALTLMLVFGVAFQLPLVMMFLSKTGLVSIEAFRRRRRYAILVMVILAAVFTPPDVVTQLLLAGPLILLYELGIIMSRVRLGASPAAEKEADS